MIAYLAGNVHYHTETGVVIVNDNIGYEVLVSPTVHMSVGDGVQLSLYIYHHRTENSEALFGFRNFQERQFFIDLISVSGVGPKSALQIMEVPMETTWQAILQADVETLKELPGVGKKTAERMILDLQAKLRKRRLERSAVSDQGSEIRVQSGEVTNEKPTMVDQSADTGDGHRHSDTPMPAYQTPVSNQDAIAALVALGYSRLEATRMLGNVPVDIVETDAIVKYALKGV